MHAMFYKYLSQSNTALLRPSEQKKTNARCNSKTLSSTGMCKMDLGRKQIDMLFA